MRHEGRGMGPASYGWPVTRLVDDIWTASVPIRFAGAWFPHVMTVIRLPDGSLVLHSPCRLSENLATEINALGPVKHIIAPNWFHDLYLAEYASFYSGADLWGPRFLQKLKGRGLVNRTFDDDPPWADVMPHHNVLGLLAFDEALFFHRPSETLIAADLLMNLAVSDDVPVLTRVAFKVFGASDGLRVFPLLRLAVTQYGSVRDAKRQIMNWKPKNVIAGHGFPVVKDATSRLTRAFDWLGSSAAGPDDSARRSTRKNAQRENG